MNVAVDKNVIDRYHLEDEGVVSSVKSYKNSKRKSVINKDQSNCVFFLCVLVKQINLQSLLYIGPRWEKHIHCS